jgi:hypothetical protein
MKKQVSFLTLDNGGRPFKVNVDSDKITVFKRTNIKDHDAPPEYNKQVLKTKYESIFVGKDPKVKQSVGNTCLIKLSAHEYIYIGEMIYSFKIPDEIVKYKSPVGNSAVPYPYAIGTENTYLLTEYTYIPNNMREAGDPYKQYYGLNTPLMKQRKETYKLKVKVIHKRLYK